MGYIKGEDREQITLFPEVIDDYISAENPVRFIEAFVNKLDCEKLGFQHAIVNSTGRPPYHPADLMKLYIYGYLNRIRSSRRLEKEAGRNLELMWLLKKLQPDFKTIADFRKNNLSAIKQVYREFTVLCKKLELFGAELVAIDGSKFKAVNSKKHNYNEKKLQRALKEIDEKIAGYLRELDEQDKAESVDKRATAEQLQEKIATLEKRSGQYQELLEKLSESGETQISTTDTDSRKMPVNNKGTDICYNVQSVVDAKHKLIVDIEVTNDVTDQQQLHEMASRAKEVLEVKSLEVLADTGYYNAESVKACEEDNITAYIPKPHPSAHKKEGLFSKEDFHYHVDKDCYSCPAGQTLSYRFSTIEQERSLRYYATSACNSCAIKGQCTTNKKGRRITRLADESIMEAMQQRLAAQPEKYRLRKQIVEHPFGTMKRWMESGYFLLKGLEKVRAEIRLTALAYMITRVTNILGVEKMIAALG